jgi:hypothetical protein
MTRADSSVDDHQLAHAIESAMFPLREIRLERPHSVAFRSLNLKECRLQGLMCDDEHIIIHAVCFQTAFIDSSYTPNPQHPNPKAPVRTTSAHDGDKLNILSFWRAPYEGPAPT